MKLQEFIVRRLILLIPVIMGVSIFTFAIAQIIPADPAAALCGEKCGVMGSNGLTAYESNVIRLGLDKPVWQQYLIYVTNLLDGNWGESVTFHRPVIEKLKDAAPITLEMSFLSLAMGFPMGISLGIFSAVWQDKLFDQFVRFVAIAFVSLPIFWLAMMFQYILGTQVGICDPITQALPLVPDTDGGCFPIYGRHDPTYTFPDTGTGFHLIDSWIVDEPTKFNPLTNQYEVSMSHSDMFFDTLKHLFLPCFTLAIASTGGLLRYMRASLLEVMNEDYVRTARAKGISETRVILVHAVRNALVPIVTILGFSIGGAIGGAVLTETIFAFPGMGKTAVDAIVYLDFSMIMGVTLVTAIIFLLSNLLVDISYAIVDPRVRLE